MALPPLIPTKMIELTLTPYPGDLLWHDGDAPKEVIALPALWCSGTGDFNTSCNSTIPFLNVSSSPVTALGSSIHGRSCYLGQIDERHYFAKGIGWVYSLGWQPDHGSFGIVPQWAAEHERDFALRLTAMGIQTVRPEAIIAHRVIPDDCGGPPRKPENVIDLDGTLAKPCMYVYSSAARWRLADLYYLSECERRKLLGDDNDQREWMKTLLTKLGLSSRKLHDAGGHDYSLSPHNVFTDGTRLDFEYSCLPEMSHRNPALNADAAVWQDKERDGLRELGWQIAELLRLKVTGKEVTEWWRSAYSGANP